MQLKVKTHAQTRKQSRGLSDMMRAGTCGCCKRQYMFHVVTKAAKMRGFPRHCVVEGDVMTLNNFRVQRLARAGGGKLLSRSHGRQTPWVLPWSCRLSLGMLNAPRVLFKAQRAPVALADRA